jgi:hypothetical protein
MAQVRIYIMYPAQGARTWHVSMDGRDGQPFPDEPAAMRAACERAQVMEQMGDDVTVLEEDEDGAWHIVRE